MARFADQMIAALSSMFRQAVKRGKTPFNPCLGMDKAHKAIPMLTASGARGVAIRARVRPVEIKIRLFLDATPASAARPSFRSTGSSSRPSAYRASYPVQGA